MAAREDASPPAVDLAARCEVVLQPREEEPSPRLQHILTSLDLMPSTSVLCCEAAASMDVETFGERTEAVREWALHELAVRRAPRPRAPAPAAVVRASPALLVPYTGEPAPYNPPSCSASSSLAAPLSTALVVAQDVRATVHSSAAASAAAQVGAAARESVLATEEAEIERAVDEFMRVAPCALLLHSPSALSDSDRLESRRRHLLTCGASSVRAGTAIVREWLAFCERRHLSSYGLPVDEDLVCVFLTDVDAAARQRALGRSRQTGASVLHSMACAARWVTDHAGMPFGAAKARLVRKSSAPVRERDPAWSEMWEPAVVVHLLRVAADGSHRGLVRAMAASLFFVCAASMRLINGQRSAPHFALWCAMLDAMQWPCSSLVQRMVYGFPTVGEIPDSEVWRPCERPADCSFREFISSNVGWVAQCRHRVLAAARAEPERASACWQRTIEECSAGLIVGPYSVAQLNQSPLSGFPAFGFGKWHPLPRFAIRQKEKWRCIDDGAASKTNASGMSTHETIVCDRPDSPLRIGLRFHALGSPPLAPSLPVIMGGGTDDKFAAYRAVVTAHPGYTVVMVAKPSDSQPGAWEDVLFRVPGHNFGLASAVLNFYHVAEPPTVFSRLFFGCPVTRYYDDHGVHEPSYAAGSGQHCHFELHEILRFHFDFSKHEPWSRSVLYTGVRTDWSADAQGVVTVGVSRSRRDSVRALIAEALSSGSLSAAAASSLRGKARFCLCPMFGRAGLAAVRLLSERQRASGPSEIDDELSEALSFLDVVIDRLPDFCVQFRRERVLPAVTILSDASWETGHSWLGFLVVCPIRGARWAGVSTPQCDSGFSLFSNAIRLLARTSANLNLQLPQRRTSLYHVTGLPVEQ